MTHAVDLIASAIPAVDLDHPGRPPATAPGVCAVTGDQCDTVPRREVLKRSFTDGALLAAPGSDRVGVAAWVALRYKWERMSSWICDGKTFIRLDRAGVRQSVFSDPPASPWVAYATTSYKKHGAMRTPVNGTGSKVWLFETRLVDCSDAARTREWWTILNDALRAGFGRPVLESLVCPPAVMRRAGLRRWMEFEKWAEPRHRSALYAFLCYLLPSQKELRDERKNF